MVVCYHLIKIVNSTRLDKKYMAIFEDCQTEKQKVVHFGAKGMSDYTLHNNEERKQRYLARHSKNNENWNNYATAGALSRWILWNKKTLSASIADYKRRFQLN